MMIAAAVSAAALPASGSVWLEDLDLSRYEQRRGRPKPKAALNGGPLRMAGKTYAHGVGSRSIAEFVLDLHGNGRRFTATVGLDDSAADRKREGTVQFQVWADEKKVADSGVMPVGDAPQRIDVDLTGVRTLTLRIDDGGDTSNGDIADWADAAITLRDPAGSKPTPHAAPATPAPVLAAVDGALAIHGPGQIGTTPGKPFLFRIPATGPGTLRYAARGLPAGVTIDPASGILHGAVRKAGRYDVALTVRNASGEAHGMLGIVAGAGQLAQTPPSGWNSWNVWGTAVDDAKIRAAADALVSSGLAAHGYDTIVIDDAWQGERDGGGVLQPNAKFPDMAALTRYVHGLGLKIGIYSSPGPKTCGGYAGSYGHEAQDAAAFATWGFDFLKHDWCSYDDVAPDRSLPELQKPYRVMGEALARQARDIVYSLCQYGYGDVWRWAPEVGGNLWRTTGDLLDMWANLDSVGFRQAGREAYVGRSRWNDTDMLVVGTVGWGPNLHPTRLTPDEQVLHMTLWAMQAAPLFIGADLTRLDPFTLALLANDEMLAVDRDPLAKAGSRLWQRDRLEVWSRPLADGTYAVALFNRGLVPAEMRVEWRDLGLSGAQPVRDLWQRRALGPQSDFYGVTVPSHGAVLLKVGEPGKGK
jgi:alpha-galactosidase